MNHESLATDSKDMVSANDTQMMISSCTEGDEGYPIINGTDSHQYTKNTSFSTTASSRTSHINQQANFEDD
ncbi:MAG: hypothetical protein ACMG6E_07745 [Candidatus Roizmanbacteria bacterium]